MVSSPCAKRPLGNDVMSITATKSAKILNRNMHSLLSWYLTMLPVPVNRDRGRDQHHVLQRPNADGCAGLSAWTSSSRGSDKRDRLKAPGWVRRVAVTRLLPDYGKSGLRLTYTSQP